MPFYKYRYLTPNKFDNLIIVCDDNYLLQIYFVGTKIKKVYDAFEIFDYRKINILDDTVERLDKYFKGEKIDWIPKYKWENISFFQKEVYEILLKIPFGETLTYNDIACNIAKKRNIKRMSSQAVGQALKNNPLCIIVPCHRVVGKNNKLTGYNGGIKNKEELLKLENILN